MLFSLNFKEMPFSKMGKMNENSFLLFIVFIVTTCPTTPVIYTLKLAIVFNY